ncbi:hypothetical protein BKA93DRAFT_253634 [Sparassis latifolia]
MSRLEPLGCRLILLVGSARVGMAYWTGRWDEQDASRENVRYLASVANPNPRHSHLPLARRRLVHSRHIHHLIGPLRLPDGAKLLGSGYSRRPPLAILPAVFFRTDACLFHVCPLSCLPCARRGPTAFFHSPYIVSPRAVHNDNGLHPLYQSLPSIPFPFVPLPSPPSPHAALFLADGCLIL